MLTDLIRQVLISRAALAIIAELADPAAAYARLPALAPDVVIIGHSGNADQVDTALVRALLPSARILTLSADLTQLLGPGEHDSIAFTPDTLAERLRA